MDEGSETAEVSGTLARRNPKLLPALAGVALRRNEDCRLDAVRVGKKNLMRFYAVLAPRSRGAGQNAHPTVFLPPPVGWL
jgi:hypothetical protein